MLAENNPQYAHHTFFIKCSLLAKLEIINVFYSLLHVNESQTLIILSELVQKLYQLERPILEANIERIYIRFPPYLKGEIRFKMDLGFSMVTSWTVRLGAKKLI